MKALQAWFNALAERERRLVLLCASVVALALIWWLAIAPAISTLRSAAATHRQLDEQLQTMQALAAQAAQLKSQRALGPDEALRNLESTVKQSLGAGATLTSSDGRATLNLKGVSADALALWLSQARSNARVVPTDAKLTRSVSLASVGTTPATSTGTATVSASATAWDGVLNLALPGNKP